MWEQEKVHKAKFEELINKHRVRPTALVPLWNIAGFALGAGKNCQIYHSRNVKSIAEVVVWEVKTALSHRATNEMDWRSRVGLDTGGPPSVRGEHE